jgi:hypothetical protein
MRPVVRWVVALLAGVTILLVISPAPQASAHPLSTTAVRLDVGTDTVTATVELPLDELSIAVDTRLTATSVLKAPQLADLRTYVQRHMSATDANSQAWTTGVTGGRVAKVDGVDNLVLQAVLAPRSGSVGDLVLHYDAILSDLVSHRVFVSARYGDSGRYTTLAMLSWQTRSVPVAAKTGQATAPESRGFVSAVHLGVEHISGGSDHLLFLIMLLLPAPLAVRGRRWVRRDDLGRAGFRVVHVVTAFAIGHSLTLALGALGWVHLPTRLVESGIALSVLVSALHAIHPLVRRGEVIIAGGFGLLHGLAFAALLGELDLSRSALLTTLLGFNLGIELTQLAVVALVMPSLMVLSRTIAYPALRTGAAIVGVGLASAWLGERTGLLTTNPLAPVGEVLVQHPLLLAAGLAVLAIVCAAAQRSEWVPEPTKPESVGRTKAVAAEPPQQARLTGLG